jgi:hypothetical protein
VLSNSKENKKLDVLTCEAEAGRGRKSERLKTKTKKQKLPRQNLGGRSPSMAHTQHKERSYHP